jgi:hypothetical protein
MFLIFPGAITFEDFGSLCSNYLDFDLFASAYAVILPQPALNGPGKPITAPFKSVATENLAAFNANVSGLAEPPDFIASSAGDRPAAFSVAAGATAAAAGLTFREGMNCFACFDGFEALSGGSSDGVAPAAAGRAVLRPVSCTFGVGVTTGLGAFFNMTVRYWAPTPAQQQAGVAPWQNEAVNGRGILVIASGLTRGVLGVPQT